MEKIRVIVASQPRLMREIVMEMISGQPDIEVVAEVQEESKIIHVVGELRPDWVVINLNSPDQKPDICDSIFDRFPHIKVLAMAAERNNCISYSATLSVRSNRVESSERGILEALRGRGPALGGVFVPTITSKIN